MLRFERMLRPVLICVQAGVLVFCGSLVAAAQNSCQLNSAKSKIKHVIYIQFDNTHLMRDNPNVPSSLFPRRRWRATPMGT